MAPPTQDSTLRQEVVATPAPQRRSHRSLRLSPAAGHQAKLFETPETGQDERVTALDTRYEELEVSFDEHERVLWKHMISQSRPSYTMAMLRDIRRAMNVLKSMFRDYRGEGEPPVKFVVFASRMPGIFNLGGDLPLFVEMIRAGDREGLRDYAHACIELQYWRATKLGLPYLSVSLVQGDALGGGFEATLADDVIIAERKAKFGLPEILFNLFPGMGAYSFLSRRLDQVRAEQMIFSGRVYTAEEMHEIGLVDELVEDGMGEHALYDFIERNRRNYRSRLAVYEARRRTGTVSHEELIAITDSWVETALNLDKSDVRRMERLAKAQDRRRQK